MALHADKIVELGEQLRALDAERRIVRDALREAVIAALADEVPLAAVERWSGLTRTQVRTLARLGPE